MNNSSVGASLGEAATLLTNLVGHSVQVGMSVLGALGSVPEKIFCDVAQGRGIIGGCDCDIPAPCWEPQSLGEVMSFVAPGSQATVRLRITNSSFSTRIFTFVASPPTGVTFSESPVTLAPLQRHTVSALLQIPANAKPGSALEVVIFVRGCRNHYLRWTLRVMDCGATMCNEVDLDDGPDLIHHWYDHFYCHRECQDPRTHG